MMLRYLKCLICFLLWLVYQKKDTLCLKSLQPCLRRGMQETLNRLVEQASPTIAGKVRLSKRISSDCNPTRELEQAPLPFTLNRVSRGVQCSSYRNGAMPPQWWVSPSPTTIKRTSYLRSKKYQGRIPGYSQPGATGCTTAGKESLDNFFLS